ncbi:MAG: hypothetical protein JST92_22220 [Deltaproteobacteria bacterium]|nr:hypothetical protein [Deltaproteobacteria bacterium]
MDSRRALLLLLTLGAFACDEPRYTFLPGEWVNITGALSNLPSSCGDLTILAVRPDEDELIAGVVANGLFHWPAGASDWTKLGQGAGSAKVDNDPTAFLFDPDHPGTYYESGIHVGTGVLITRDGGDTFTRIGLNNNDYTAVDFADPDRKTMLVGAHENGQHLFLSRDAGATFTDLGPNFPSDCGDTSFPVLLDPQTFLVATSQGPNPGIFLSTDGGGTFTTVFAGNVNSHPLFARDGTISFMLVGDGGLVRSADQGRTWTRVVGAGVLLNLHVGLTELPDGRLLAVGTGTNYLLSSSDRGAHWTPISQLPYKPVGLAYSAPRRKVYIWRQNCVDNDTVPLDAIMEHAFE